MKEIFLTVLNASLYGSIVILAVLALRLVLKKAPKAFVCLLWLLAGLRLVLPFEIESSFSLQPDVEQIPQFQADYAQEPELPSQYENVPEVPNVPAVPDVSEAPDVDALPDDVQIVVNNSTVTEHSQRVIDYGQIAAWVWALGVLGLGGYSVISYGKLRKRVREAVRSSDGCWEADRIDTAFVLGFLMPKIYLPKGLEARDRDFIVAHENAHIARWDHWFKPVGYLILAVHWFNPLVWMAYTCLCRDIEMACDERVVKSMGVEDRKAYSQALLTCASSHRAIAACPVAFGEVSVRQRILSVLNYRKPGFWVTVAAVLALVFVAVCLMTSPAANDLTDFVSQRVNQVTGGALLGEEGLTYKLSDAEVRELRDLLKSVRYSPEPTQEDTSGEDISQYHHLVITCGETTDRIYFTSDYRTVWAEVSGERTPMYSIDNPGILRDFYDAAFLGVVGRETSGEPFATVEEPWAWTQGISMNAVKEATFHVEYPAAHTESSTSASSTGGIFPAQRFEALLEILNTLPKDALASSKNLTRTTASLLQSSFGSSGGLSVTIMDGVNQLAAIIRLEKDTVKLILCNEPEKLENESQYLDNPRCWNIENEALLTYMKELLEYPTSISYLAAAPTDEPGKTPAEPVLRCVTAMKQLIASENVYVHKQNLDDKYATENIFMRSQRGNLFQYILHWNEQDFSVMLLEYDGYRFWRGQLFSKDGTILADSKWQTAVFDGDMEIVFPDVSPYYLDWDNLDLTLLETQITQDEEVISLLYTAPSSEIIRFHFSGGNLIYFDRKDTSGDPESTTNRDTVVYPGEGDVASHLANLYSEAVQGQGGTFVQIEAFDGKAVTFDQVEWVTVPAEYPEKRFEIVNEVVQSETLTVADHCVYTVLDWVSSNKVHVVSAEEFAQLLEERQWTLTAYYLTIEDGQITAITEQYIPSEARGW